MDLTLAKLTVASSELQQPYMILLPLGLILILAKGFSLLLGKIKVPQVIGFLVAGLLVGLFTFIPNQTILTDYTVGGLQEFGKIGVILIMFSAGLGTDLKKVKAVGVPSVVITSLGVIFPLAFGFLLAFIYNKVTGGSLEIPGTPLAYTEIYYGVVLTATSVSITVATLKEMGRLNTKVGTSLVAAAILDDIIGIVLLSLIISLAKSGNAEPDTLTFAGMIMKATGSTNAALYIALILIFMILFFVFIFFTGHFVRKFFNHLGKKYPHHIRITMLALALCFLYSYVAEFFSIADITGAFMFGLVLSSSNVVSYVDHRSETISDNIFGPVFFACIALNIYTSDSGFDSKFIAFGLIWVVLGLLGKVIGAGIGGLITKFSPKDSLRIGIGMMARAEVIIVTAQKGVQNGLISDQLMIYTLILILVSSFLTPIFLKLAYKGEPAEPEMLKKED